VKKGLAHGFHSFAKKRFQFLLSAAARISTSYRRWEVGAVRDNHGSAWNSGLGLEQFIIACPRNEEHRANESRRTV
jgi:hypothetical protein